METMLREVKETRENLENELRSTQALLDKERAKSFSVQRQHEVCIRAILSFVAISSQKYRDAHLHLSPVFVCIVLFLSW